MALVRAPNAASVTAVVLLIWCVPAVRPAGTMRNIKDVFIGRCWEYQRVLQPGLFNEEEKNCSLLWTLFSDAFLYKDECAAHLDDFSQFAEAADHQKGDKPQMFWENVYPLVNDFADRGKRYFTVAGTLLGYMLDDVLFCGKVAEPGFNPDNCAISCNEADLMTTETAYWVSVSICFAKSGLGTVYGMFNASYEPTYERSTIFAMYEMPLLIPPTVTTFVIYLVHDLNDSGGEHCGTGTVKLLEEDLVKQGLTVQCIEDPPEVRHFQCADHSLLDHAACGVQLSRAASGPAVLLPGITSLLAALVPVIL